MYDFVHNYYLYIKALHVISIICWMAGLLYLPRLFVYHSDVRNNTHQNETFKIMEKKLLWYIIKPAFVFSFITGFLISIYIYDMQGLWLHIKISLALLLILYTIFLVKSYKNFEKDKNTISSKKWRLLNEIPTILMIIIVFLAVVKPT